jgi:class 3 adenylate cyclase
LGIIVVMLERPTGTVTFVFTDIEGSTALLDRLGDRYGDVLFGHHALLRGVWEAHDGVEVSTEGDAFFVAFSSASCALSATVAGQAALAGHAWPHGEPVRVRMGVHTGEPRIREGDYWGPDVHYAARVASAAHGGQVLVSAATAALASDAQLTSLGRHRLKDFPEPRELFALGSGPHPAPKTLDPLRTNLPSEPTPLVGRDDEVDALMALLLGDTHLVSVVGAGGTGKTRLALAVADRLLDKLPDGAFLVELAELTSSGQVAGAIAAAVGSTADLLARTLSGRELLLVLDNFEHVLDAASLLPELLAAAPGLRILVTSQAPLRLAEEQTFALAGLSEGPAVALLVARAERASRDFAVDESGAATMAALCRELDGSARDRVGGRTTRNALLGAVARAAAPLARRARDRRSQPARASARSARRDAVVLRVARSAGRGPVPPHRPLCQRSDARTDRAGVRRGHRRRARISCPACRPLTRAAHARRSLRGRLGAADLFARAAR